jgi:hypothetical protein
MSTNSNSPAPEERSSPWPGIVKFLLLAGLVFSLFLLAHVMVRHRFFRGRQINHFQNHSPVPTGL